MFKALCNAQAPIKLKLMSGTVFKRTEHPEQLDDILLVEHLDDPPFADHLDDPLFAEQLDDPQ